MELAFVETMRGTLGVSRTRVPVDFHVRASGGARGPFRLAGVVHAAPWVEETTCEGTLALCPRALEYDVRFLAADGRRLRLHGEKTPRLLAPLRSMTVLPIALSEVDGPELARGELTFDLFELPQFLVSWLPLPTRAHRQLAARRVAVSRAHLALRARDGRVRG